MSWRARDDDVPRPSRLLAARRALLLCGGVARLAHVPAAVDEASLEALAAGLSTYFRRTEGRDTLSRRRDRRFPLTAVPVSILFVFVVPPRDRCSL